MNRKITAIAKSEEEICTIELPTDAIIIMNGKDIPILSIKKGDKLGELELIELIESRGEAELQPTKDGIMDTGHGIVIRTPKKKRR